MNNNDELAILAEEVRGLEVLLRPTIYGNLRLTPQEFQRAVDLLDQWKALLASGDDNGGAMKDFMLTQSRILPVMDLALGCRYSQIVFKSMDLLGSLGANSPLVVEWLTTGEDEGIVAPEGVLQQVPLLLIVGAMIEETYPHEVREAASSCLGRLSYCRNQLLSNTMQINVMAAGDELFGRASVDGKIGDGALQIYAAMMRAQSPYAVASSLMALSHVCLLPRNRRLAQANKVKVALFHDSELLKCILKVLDWQGGAPPVPTEGNPDFISFAVEALGAIAEGFPRLQTVVAEVGGIEAISRVALHGSQFQAVSAIAALYDVANNHSSNAQLLIERHPAVFDIANGLLNLENREESQIVKEFFEYIDIQRAQLAHTQELTGPAVNNIGGGDGQHFAVRGGGLQEAHRVSRILIVGGVFVGTFLTFLKIKKFLGARFG